MIAPSSIPASSDSPQVVELKRELQRAYLKIQVLELRLRLQRIQKYGPASEKLNDAQLELLELEPGVSSAEVQAESEREPPPATTDRRKSRPHPGRQELPADLPRVERVIACAPEQCACRACGQPMAVIGYDQSEQLDVEPAKYFVQVTKREKRACQSCGEGGVVAAPVPARIIDKGLVSDRVVIDTLVAKYGDHLPLYRQSAILERETGLEIGRATLDGWVMRVGESLIPMTAVIGRELVGGSYIQADETPVDVQMHDRRGKNHQAYLWQYSRPGGSAVFDFRLGRDAPAPESFWAGSRAFSRPTATSLTSRWAGRRWCTSVVGHMPGESSTRRSSSARRIRLPLAWWRRSTNCSRSTPGRARRISTTPPAMRCASSKRDRCWS